MESRYSPRPGRVSGSAPGHRVLVELPHVESIELFFGADFEGVDPHTHADHTDSFYVLEGEVEFFQNGAWHRAGPGTFVSVPPDVDTDSAARGRPSACSTSTHRTSASSTRCGTASSTPGV